MFCTKCGSKLENNSKFCINCGNPTNISTYNTNNNQNNVEHKKKEGKLVTCLCLLAYIIPILGIINLVLNELLFTEAYEYIILFIAYIITA